MQTLPDSYYEDRMLLLPGNTTVSFPSAQDVVLIRAMRDSNLPKFLVDDVELFQNIIRDLFPGVNVPDQVGF